MESNTFRGFNGHSSCVLIMDALWELPAKGKHALASRNRAREEQRQTDVPKHYGQHFGNEMLENRRRMKAHGSQTESRSTHYGQHQSPNKRQRTTHRTTCVDTTLTDMTLCDAVHTFDTFRPQNTFVLQVKSQDTPMYEKAGREGTSFLAKRCITSAHSQWTPLMIFFLFIQHVLIAKRSHWGANSNVHISPRLAIFRQRTSWSFNASSLGRTGMKGLRGEIYRPSVLDSMVYWTF